jgi:hypothetical protein
VAVLDHGEIKHPGEEWKKVMLTFTCNTLKVTEKISPSVEWSARKKVVVTI